MGQADYVRGVANVIDYTPGSAVSAGDVVVQGELVAVAKLAIEANRLGHLAIGGEYDVDKASGTDFSVGDKVDWNDTANRATGHDPASSNELFGVCVIDSESGAPKVCLRLTSSTQGPQGASVTGETGETGPTGPSGP